MTSSEQETPMAKVSSEHTDAQNDMTPCIFSRMWVFLLVFLIGISGTILANTLHPEWFEYNHETAQQHFMEHKVGGTALHQTMHDLSLDRVIALENKVAELEAKINKLSSPSTGAIEGDFTKLKEGVKTLFQTSETIGTKIESAIGEIIEGKKHIQANVATIVTFMQLKDKAMNGMPFKAELDKLAKVTDSTKIKEEAKAISSIAEKSTATLIELYQEWEAIAPKASNALRQSEASDWKERVAIALDSLIAVKSLNESEGTAVSTSAIIQSIETDILSSNINAAITKVEALPTAAKVDAVANWLVRAKERQALEEAVTKIAEAITIEEPSKTAPKASKTEAKK